jgi:hypothetical protein
MRYLVLVWPRRGLTNEQIEAMLSDERDWLRLDDMSWLVRSERDARQLSGRLQRLLGASQHVVLRVNRNDAQGRMSEDFWEWFNRAPD